VIRRRLVALILAVVALVTAISGVLIVTTLRSRLLDSLDRELATRSSAVAPERGHGGGGDGGGGDGGGGDGGGGGGRPRPPREGAERSPFEVRRYAFVEIDASGAVVSSVTSGPEDDPDPLPDVAGLRAPAGPVTVGSMAGGDQQFRVILDRQGDGSTLVTGLSLEDVDRSVKTAREIVVLAGVFAVALAGAIVWLTVRRSLRPIDQMVVTAERIAAGDLAERAPVPQPATEIGHLGTALNLMLDRIEAAVDAKTASEARTRRFAADASHELRTPLTSIRGYAELYRRGARSDDDVARAMTRIEHEAVRMGDLVEDLLLLTRLDQGRPLEQEPVDVTAVVLDAVAAARVVDPERAIEVDVHQDPVVVTGDAHRLRQVVDNLLANVRDHTPPGTSTTVQLSIDGGLARLNVADDGPGMDAEAMTLAFERFWQAGGDTAKSGAGLGLAIVSEIVAAHGGGISLDTRPGAGATFTVTLPRHNGL